MVWRDGSSYLVQPDDVWVAKHLHDLDLSKYLLQVLLIQLCLINDLYSHLEENRAEVVGSAAAEEEPFSNPKFCT